MGTYRIPRGRVRTELRVSNSRFVATAGPVFSQKEARAFVRSIRGEMPDATHHVHAFRVGHGASVTEGLSDDGEPSGTAGPPVMAVLRGSDIGDAAVVITRYFGGTKLGTGGLVAAYTRAAQLVLEVLETEEKVQRVCGEVLIPYAVLNPMLRIIGAHDGSVEEQDFAGGVRLRFRLPREQWPALTAAVRALGKGTITLRLLD